MYSYGEKICCSLLMIHNYQKHNYLVCDQHKIKVLPVLCVCVFVCLFLLLWLLLFFFFFFFFLGGGGCFVLVFFVVLFFSFFFLFFFFGGGGGGGWGAECNTTKTCAPGSGMISFQCSLVYQPISSLKNSNCFKVSISPG